MAKLLERIIRLHRWGVLLWSVDQPITLSLVWVELGLWQVTTILLLNSKKVYSQLYQIKEWVSSLIVWSKIVPEMMNIQGKDFFILSQFNQISGGLKIAINWSYTWFFPNLGLGDKGAQTALCIYAIKVSVLTKYEVFLCFFEASLSGVWLIHYEFLRGLTRP